MERRTKLGLLILVALLILAFGIWYLLQPIIKTVQLPPALIQNPPATNLPATNTSPTIPVGGGAAEVPQDLKKLQDLAKVIVARIGTGANTTGFVGYTDVLIDATPAYQTVLKSDQLAMQTAHPARGTAFGMTTRVVSATALSLEVGAPEVQFLLQTQRAEDAGDPSHPTLVAYKEATVTFQRQPDGTYLLSNVVWKDIER